MPNWLLGLRISIQDFWRPRRPHGCRPPPVSRSGAASPRASAARDIPHRCRPRPRRLSAEGRESVWGRKEFRSRASASLIPHFAGFLPRPLPLSLPSSPISLTLASSFSHSFFLAPVPAAHVRSSQVDRALALQQVAFAFQRCEALSRGKDVHQQ